VQKFSDDLEMTGVVTGHVVIHIQLNLLITIKLKIK